MPLEPLIGLLLGALMANLSPALVAAYVELRGVKGVSFVGPPAWHLPGQFCAPYSMRLFYYVLSLFLLLGNTFYSMFLAVILFLGLLSAAHFEMMYVAGAARLLHNGQRCVVKIRGRARYVAWPLSSPEKRIAFRLVWQGRRVRTQVLKP